MMIVIIPYWFLSNLQALSSGTEAHQRLTVVFVIHGSASSEVDNVAHELVYVLSEKLGAIR